MGINRYMPKSEQLTSHPVENPPVENMCPTVPV